MDHPHLLPQLLGQLVEGEVEGLAIGAFEVLVDDQRELALTTHAVRGSHRDPEGAL